MKIKLWAFVLFLAVILSACGRGLSSRSVASEAPPLQTAALSVLSGMPAEFSHSLQLDDFAQLERAGTWFAGMGFAESAIRESAGDYAGAVAAAYKELSWNYGRGLIQKAELEQALLNALALNSDVSVAATVNAVIAFSREQWDEAAAGLEALFGEDEDPDSFGNWMLLVCILERNRNDRRAAAAYQSIRARYVQFPEYWYRGARVLTGLAAAEFAENCINVSPQGPFAQDSRNMLAVFSGLRSEDGSAIKTKSEIEAIIADSLRSGNPHLLDSLLPLIGLPDNPYTLFALGALQVLNTFQIFNEYFSAQAASSRGRLAERLSYLSRS